LQAVGDGVVIELSGVYKSFRRQPVLRGVDPVNVQAIDTLKRRLAAYSPRGSR